MKKISLFLSQNQVELQDDWLGISHDEVIDNTFLTVEPFDLTTEEASVMEEPFKFEMTVELSNVKYLH